MPWIITFIYKERSCPWIPGYNIILIKVNPYPGDMEVNLPNSAFIGNINSFIRELNTEGENELKITTHDEWIHVHPLVLCMTAAIGCDIDSDKIECDSLTAKSSHYLERMNLFQHLDIEPEIEIEEHEPSGRFIPVTQVEDESDKEEFIQDMIPLLHLDKEQREPVQYIVSELLSNAMEHSGSDIGAMVAAQYYEDSNMIRIGIADRGFGIKRTIQRHHGAPDDLSAIRLALKPGVTGKVGREGGTESNAGAGLFFIKSIAATNEDHFMIYSGNSLYKLLKKQNIRKQLNSDPFEDRYSEERNLPEWEGTVVGIDISLDDSKEFSKILDRIQKTYTKSIKERKKKRSKRSPRFQ